MVNVAYFIMKSNSFMPIVSISETVIKQPSGKLKRQPAGFPQRGKPDYSSARSPYLPVKLAFHARSPPDGFLFSLPD